MFSGKKNRYPYIILFLIHTALLLYAFARVNNRKPLVVLLLSNMGIAYLFEYIIFSFLRLYRYKPKFFKNNFLDGISGAILSQAIYVPFTALFITALKLNWIVKIAFAFYFSMVELLFIRMGIFKKQGWKTRYTFLLIVAYFYFSDLWLSLLKKGNTLTQKITLYNMVHFTGINSIVALEMLRKLRFGLGRYHSIIEQHNVETTYAAVMSAIKTWAGIKKNFALKIILLLVKMMVDQTLKNKGIIKIKSILPITVIDIMLLGLGPVYKKWIEDIEEKQGERSMG